MISRKNSTKEKNHSYETSCPVISIPVVMRFYCCLQKRYSMVGLDAHAGQWPAHREQVVLFYLLQVAFLTPVEKKNPTRSECITRDKLLISNTRKSNCAIE